MTPHGTPQPATDPIHRLQARGYQEGGGAIGRGGERGGGGFGRWREGAEKRRRVAKKKRGREEKKGEEKSAVWIGNS